MSEDDSDEMLLFNVVYCSRATVPLDTPEIESLLAVARRNNASQSITGWLVYSHGIFFQWLEGRRDDVAGLMKIIADDPRHANVVVLTESEEVRERLFDGWDMELVSAEDIRSVLVDAASESNDAQHRRALERLMKELDFRLLKGDELPPH